MDWCGGTYHTTHRLAEMLDACLDLEKHYSSGAGILLRSQPSTANLLILAATYVSRMLSQGTDFGELPLQLVTSLPLHLSVPESLSASLASQASVLLQGVAASAEDGVCAPHHPFTGVQDFPLLDIT